MPVGIADVDLRESGGGTGLQDHAVRIVNTGVLAVAFRAEEIYRLLVIRYAHRKVDITGIKRLLDEKWNGRERSSEVAGNCPNETTRPEN